MIDLKKLAAAPLVAAPDFLASGPFTCASNASNKLPGAFYLK